MASPDDSSVRKFLEGLVYLFCAPEVKRVYENTYVLVYPQLSTAYYIKAVVVVLDNNRFTVKLFTPTQEDAISTANVDLREDVFANSSYIIREIDSALNPRY